MKLKTLIYAFLFLILAKATPVYATHIFGGELIYKYLSGNNYQVILNIYGDCAGSATPNSAFTTLAGATPKVVLTGNGNIDTLVLTPDAGSNVEVTPVCPSQVGQTTCSSPQGPVPGIKRFIYSTTVSLAAGTTNWQFTFYGNMGSASGAGRSNNITNINSPGASIVYLAATLNTSSGPNSSPIYTTIPTPFYCENVAEQYNQGAIDPNSDSLSFSLINAIDANTNGPSQYISPYSGSNPLSVVPGLFTFSPSNGQMNFTPNTLQDALVVNQVSEYRNGVLVGTSMREMTFIVLNNCTGLPPTGSIDPVSVNGGKISFDDSNKINICTGTANVSFDINVITNSGDTVNVIANNALTNSSLTITNNNTGHPKVSFSLQSGSLPVGIYNFYLTMQDNHCPISDKQTIAYTINIVDPYTFTDSLVYPTQCIHQAFMKYDIESGVYPVTFTLLQGSTTVKSSEVDSAGIIYDSLVAGKYTVILHSNYLDCSTTDTFTIIDSGRIPLPPIVSDVYCKNDPVHPVDFPIVPGATVTWQDMNGNISNTAPNISSSSPGTFYWYITQHYNSCSSAIDTMQVVVNDLPQISFPEIPSDVCLGDTVYLKAQGGVYYYWEPINEVFKARNDSPATRVLEPTTFTVIVTTHDNCVDSAQIAIQNVAPCCVFSYPNAFTPNKDGKNDFFHPIVYGHTEDFELSVFNRWGQRVFHSYSQYNLWDGTFDGQECPIGTYSYFITSKCLSGKKEMHKGDVILIR